MIPNLKLLFLKTLFKWINASSVFTFVSLPHLLDSYTFHASFWLTFVVSLVHYLCVTRIYCTLYFLNESLLLIKKMLPCKSKVKIEVVGSIIVVGIIWKVICIIHYIWKQMIKHHIVGTYRPCSWIIQNINVSWILR